MRSIDEVQKIKDEYIKGLRIKIIELNDPYRKIPQGLKGTVDHVDDIGTVHMIWDDGSTLGLIIDEDKFEIIS